MRLPSESDLWYVVGTWFVSVVYVVVQSESGMREDSKHCRLGT